MAEISGGRIQEMLWMITVHFIDCLPCVDHVAEKGTAQRRMGKMSHLYGTSLSSEEQRLTRGKHSRESRGPQLWKNATAGSGDTAGDGKEEAGAPDDDQ